MSKSPPRAAKALFLPSEIRAAFGGLFEDVPVDGVVVLHSARSSIGTVVGGLDEVVDALLGALGEKRTLVVPTFTMHLTEPAGWIDPPAPREMWDVIRAELPYFDPAQTTPHAMGRLAEAIWRRPGAIRSSHPAESVAAIGPRAAHIVRPHPIDDPRGPRSPWGRMVEVDARIVLLGVGLERCSMIHHVEQLAAVPYLAGPDYAMPVLVEGERRWVEVDGGGCSEGFGRLEPVLRAAHAVHERRIGAAPTLVLSARRLLEVALPYLRADPSSLLCEDPSCPHCTAARQTCLAATAAGDFPRSER